MATCTELCIPALSTETKYTLAIDFLTHPENLNDYSRKVVKECIVCIRGRHLLSKFNAVESKENAVYYKYHGERLKKRNRFNAFAYVPKGTFNPADSFDASTSCKYEAELQKVHNRYRDIGKILREDFELRRNDILAYDQAKTEDELEDEDEDDDY